MHFYANQMKDDSFEHVPAQDPDDKTLLGMFFMFIGVVTLTLVIIMIML